MIASRRAASLGVLSAVMFLTFLDTTIVAVALASIQASLHAGVADLQWVVGGYALAFGSLMLFFGSVGDRFGRKRVMLIGLGVFVAGSIIAALAVVPVMLIVGRIIMGLGAAASEPGTLSLIRHLFPEDASRARALGVWSAVAGLALAVGPVIGGVLVGIGSWPAIFWFNVAAGAIVGVLALIALPESTDPDVGRIDRSGGALGLLALAAVIFGLIQGEGLGYGAGLIIASFCVALVAFVAFVATELRSRNPMLNLRYLRRPSFAGALSLAFAVYFSIFAIFFFTALYLQVVEGYSAYRIALVFLPMALAMILSSLGTGPWVARSGVRVPIATGSVVAALGVFGVDAGLAGSTHSLVLGVALAVAGIGFGVTVVPVTSIALKVVPSAHSGMAAASTNTARALGVIASVSVLGSYLNGQLTSGLAAKLARLGVPPVFRQVVINAVETGGVPGGSGTKAAEAAYGPLVAKVVSAAYGAFHSGLTLSLIIAGALMLVFGLASAAAVRGHPSRRA